MIGYLVIALIVAKTVFLVTGVKNYTKQSKFAYSCTRLIVSIWAKLWMWGFGI